MWSNSSHHRILDLLQSQPICLPCMLNFWSLGWGEIFLTSRQQDCHRPFHHLCLVEITKVGHISNLKICKGLSGTSFCVILIILCFCFLQILDIVPILARLYFQGKLPVTLSYVPASILLCVGLQQRNITFIEVWFSTCQLDYFISRMCTHAWTCIYLCARKWTESYLEKGRKLCCFWYKS